MQIILVRHAQPVAEINTDRIADPGLSELGRWQADRLRDWLTHEPIDAVITSPKTRAIETVQPLIDHHAVDHTVVDGLDEIDRGSFVYIPTDRLAEEGGDYWDAILEQRWDEIGWDHPRQFRDRVVAAWEAILADPPGERILVGAHGGSIRLVLAHVAGVVDRRFEVAIDYAGISRVTVTDDAFQSVHSINETGHFEAARDGLTGVMRDARPPGGPAGSGGQRVEEQIDLRRAEVDGDTGPDGAAPVE